MHRLKRLLLLAALSLFSIALFAQESDSINHAQCGTMERQENRFRLDPAARLRFEAQNKVFSKAVSERRLRTLNESEKIIYTIPVVFHVVLTGNQQVTDAQIQAQLDTLNKDFAGHNGDSVKIPAGFKPLFGKSGIQFCLAQRTPDGQKTTGIERTLTTQTAFSNLNDWVKHASNGGANIWDQTKYFNVWVCALNNGILGYSTFPTENTPDEQGVAIDYRSVPGGTYTNFNGGKTLVHESGHYFNLFHIWGNSDNSCSDSDEVDDTPNQYNSTTGCFSGTRTDQCTNTGNGIMYQNYMDYSYDPCLVMFTAQQVVRIESALSIYRSSLLSSNGCEPVIDKNYDAALLSIDNPLQRVCESTFTPAVTFRNEGSQTLTSLNISTRIDNGPVTVYNWTGLLARLTNVSVTLTKLTTTTGVHTLKIYVDSPNGTADERTANDTLSLVFQYLSPVSSVSEGFEGQAFPPDGWDLVNSDNGITWARVTTAAKSGVASAAVNNFNYVLKGQKDDLRMPNLVLENLDSAFLSFQVAAASLSSASGSGNFDTLEVIISSDCGRTFSSIYKKWGSSLNTQSVASSEAFTPSAAAWRKDSINLSAYINMGPVVIAFRSTNGYQNNIYLDDVNLRKVIVDPYLKQKGLLITPNPASSEVAVRFYPQPVTLQGIQLYNTLGQKLAEVRVGSGGANNYYSFNMNSYAAGTYIVRVVFSDSVVTRKIIKL